MVHRLPLDEQEAVIVALEGLSRRESAAELGITAGMYQGRLARGLALIQGMVNEPLEPVFSKDTCLGAAHLEEYLGAFQI
jgi:DNA-directed RNA polymerase specialized sigma24 family protein